MRFFAAYTELVFLSTLKWFLPAPQKAQAFFCPAQALPWSYPYAFYLAVFPAPPGRRAGAWRHVVAGVCRARDGHARRRFPAAGRRPQTATQA